MAPPAADPDATGPTAPSVLLAEHEPAVAEMLVRYLDRAGFGVQLASAPELALAGLAAGACAAAVLDLTMPGLDPRRVRRALRIPVVFLVAPGPRPHGLNRGGARRWLIRPFGPRMLVATVQELLREALAGPGGQVLAGQAPGGQVPAGQVPAGGTQAAGPALASLAIDGLRLDLARRVAVVTGGSAADRVVPLTGGECRVLAAMLAAPGRARSRRQLLAAAGRSASDRAADVYIAQLRAKIGVPGLIRTVRGAGYAVGETGGTVRGEPGAELGGGPKLRGQ